MVLDKEPGRTDVTVQQIESDNSASVWQVPYQILHAHQDTVKIELDQFWKMESLNLSDLSHSFSNKEGWFIIAMSGVDYKKLIGCK